MQLSTSFVAVPALSRVDPVTISGPVSTRIETSAGVGDLLGGHAGHEHRLRAALAGPFDRGMNEGRGAAGGDAENDVAGAHPARFELAPRGVGIVLGALDRGDQRPFAASEDALHQSRVGAESGRAFGSVEHSQPAAGARADVEQPATVRQGRADEFDRRGDLRPRGVQGGVHLDVVALEQLDRGLERERVELERTGVPRFGGELLVSVRGGHLALRPGDGAFRREPTCSGPRTVRRRQPDRRR